ncbi:MAG: protease HtpX, partial [Selenomonas sp.]|nr:protease HtpX [Selenomonas sp.]
MNTLKTTMLMALLMALMVALGGVFGGHTGMTIMLIIAVGMNFFSYWFSDSMVLRMYNAQEIDRSSAPELYGLVEKLAGNAGLPMPRVYIINE